MTLGKIGNFGRPIVHLDVDVGVYIAVPWRVVAVVPNPL